MKRWVFDPALNCPRLVDDERSCDGSAFQTAGAATLNYSVGRAVFSSKGQACRGVLRTKIYPTRNEVNTLTVDRWAVTFDTARRGLGGAAARPCRPLFAVPNITAHPSTASVPITTVARLWAPQVSPRH